MQGVKDGLAVTAGQGLTNFAASKVPFGQTSQLGRGLTQIGLGLLGSFVVKKVTKSDRYASMYAAGAFSNVLKPLLAPIPVVGPSLAGMSSYVQPRRVSSYVQPRQLSGYAAAPAGAPMVGGNGDDANPAVDDDASMMMA